MLSATSVVIVAAFDRCSIQIAHVFVWGYLWLLSSQCFLILYKIGIDVVISHISIIVSHGHGICWIDRVVGQFFKCFAQFGFCFMRCARTSVNCLQLTMW